MIKVLEFNTAPLEIGEQRRLVLDGDGPFQVGESCFVEHPPPQGFRRCPQCSTRVIAAKRPLLVEADGGFWKGKIGNLELEIRDTVGESLKLELRVIADTHTESGPALAMA